MEVMVDLETLDTHHTAVILSIGAVAFDAEGVYHDDAFYRAVSIDSNLGYGRTISESTLVWWMRQSDGARSAAFLKSGAVSLLTALTDFDLWFDKKANIWGNGANFDISLLADAYAQLEMAHPWKYNNVRCHRTLKNLPGMTKYLSQAGEPAHHALSDAVRQAEEASKMLKALQ